MSEQKGINHVRANRNIQCEAKRELIDFRPKGTNLNKYYIMAQED